MQDQERLTLREAADALGISEVSARRWVKSGKLRAAQPGRKYLIPRSAVEELLNPKAMASSESEYPRLRKWLEEQGARRILMADAEMLENFERMASTTDRQDIPSRFEQEAREAIQEEGRILEDLQGEWVRGGDLIPKSGADAGARMTEKARLGREIRLLYRRYLTTLDRFGEALFLEGRADDFVMVADWRRPQIAEARKAALQALREEAFRNEQGA
jgi:excisionase family DNA binding protein